jgi:hypothetical protein
MISRVQALGYQFATAGECLGDPAINWYRDPVTGQPVGTTKLQAAAKAPIAATNTSSNLPTASASGNFGAGTSPKPTMLQNSTTKSNASSITVTGQGLDTASTFMFGVYLLVMIATMILI